MKQPYDYDLKHIKNLRDRINASWMSVPDGFKKCNSKRLRGYYNGVGPDRWSQKHRKLFTRILNVLEAPALIHDYEFSQRKKSYWRFTIANFRLMWNCLLDWHLRLGVTAGVTCQIFGYSAYKKGGKKK